MKLYRKGKGKSLILRELRSRLIDVEYYEDIICELEECGDIDFYQSCNDILSKKQFDVSNSADKSKAYAYLSRKGFGSDEIKEAFTLSEKGKI